MSFHQNSQFSYNNLLPKIVTVDMRFVMVMAVRIVHYVCTSRCTSIQENIQTQYANPRCTLDEY